MHDTPSQWKKYLASQLRLTKLLPKVKVVFWNGPGQVPKLLHELLTWLYCLD